MRTIEYSLKYSDSLEFKIVENKYTTLEYKKLPDFKKTASVRENVGYFLDINVYIKGEEKTPFIKTIFWTDKKETKKLNKEKFSHIEHSISKKIFHSLEKKEESLCEIFEFDKIA